MSLNYAQKWQPELLETFIQNTLCSPYVVDNVRWLDAKTFHFTQMSVSGYKNHNRSGGWNQGTFTQTDKAYTCDHDRDVEFLVDKADVDETNATASIQNISRAFEETQVAPEADALFFSTVAQEAQKVAALHSSTGSATYTAANIFAKLKGYIGKVKRYRANGLIMYLSSTLMDLLEMSDDFTRKIEVTQIAEGGVGLETRVTDIDGVPIMEVIDDDRFYDKFNFMPTNGGFVAAAGAHRINVLLATPKTTKVVPKIQTIYYFAPGTHTKGDGYLYQNRSLSGVFVFPNGKDGAVDSVYVDVDTAAVS